MVLSSNDAQLKSKTNKKTPPPQNPKSVCFGLKSIKQPGRTAENTLHMPKQTRIFVASLDLGSIQRCSYATNQSPVQNLDAHLPGGGMTLLYFFLFNQ